MAGFVLARASAGLADSTIRNDVSNLEQVRGLVERPLWEMRPADADIPHRDRALVAFYVSTGARACELLSATRDGVDPGRQLITVIRKGTREAQELPASTDAFVWLRLYQVEMEGLVPKGRKQPLWWTLRRPFRPLTYHAAHRMFERVNAQVGSSATLHALRHTAAYRMAEDPSLPLTDVQFVLGHAQLSTTQIYLTHGSGIASDGRVCAGCLTRAAS